MFSKAYHNGHYGYFSSVNLSVSQVLQERSDGAECIAAFDSYSASGYVIRCNQRERRTSRSHQHLHIALLLQLEQIRSAVLIHHVSVAHASTLAQFFRPQKTVRSSGGGRVVHI